MQSIMICYIIYPVLVFADFSSIYPVLVFGNGAFADCTPCHYGNSHSVSLKAFLLDRNGQLSCNPPKKNPFLLTPILVPVIALGYAYMTAAFWKDEAGNIAGTLHTYIADSTLFAADFLVRGGGGGYILHTACIRDVPAAHILADTHQFQLLCQQISFSCDIMC